MGRQIRDARETTKQKFHDINLSRISALIRKLSYPLDRPIPPFQGGGTGSNPVGVRINDRAGQAPRCVLVRRSSTVASHFVVTKE
jgi:hypothetical protein